MISQLIDKHLLNNNINKHILDNDKNISNNIHQHSINTHQFNQTVYPIQENNLMETKLISQNQYNKIQFIPQQQNFILNQQTQLIKQSSSKSNDLIPGTTTCTKCNKTFLKHAHLLRHINQRHQNNRSFICKEKQCGKTFKRDSHLRRHIISHTHQKLHQCNMCIMAFGYKHHLDRHIKGVHQKSLLICQECGQSFSKKKPFLKHVQRVHSKNGEDQNNKIKNCKQRKDFLNTKKQDGDESNKGGKTKKIKKDWQNNKIRKQKLSNVEQNEQKQQEQKMIKQSKQNANLNKIIQKDQVYIYNDYENKLIDKNDQQKRVINQSQQSRYRINSKKLYNNNKQQQCLMFRCIYNDCVSAFGRMNELMRHIKQKHKQYEISIKNQDKIINNKIYSNQDKNVQIIPIINK